MKTIRKNTLPFARFQNVAGSGGGCERARAIEARPRSQPAGRKPNTARSPIVLMALFFGALIVSATGCSSVQVQPWQRATLADYTMRPDRDPLATMAAEHTFFSREAAASGRGVGGAGCGCN